MTIREFQAANVDLENQDQTFVAVQQLRGADAAPAIFEQTDKLGQWDPWG